MPKFARPTSYTGKQGNQSWTGQSRFANQEEVTAGTSEQLAISPATLAGAIGTVVPPATTTVAGLVELATNAEAVTGTATTNLAINPGSLTARLAAPGSIGATTPATALSTAKLNVTSGANASVGTSAAMTAGTIVVATTAVTASSIIFVSHNTIAGTAGAVSAPAASRIAGTSFTITSSSNTDTSTVNWLIVN